MGPYGAQFLPFSLPLLFFFSSLFFFFRFLFYLRRRFIGPAPASGGQLATTHKIAKCNNTTLPPPPVLQYPRQRTRGPASALIRLV